MSIGVYFAPESLTEAQYDESIKRLEAAGAGAPKGREYHVCFYEGEKLHVFEIWNSQEDFGAFGATLMPILSDVGINPGEPMISPVHNSIKS